MRALVLALVLAMALTAGCATVHPWERETLASPSMAEQTDPDASAFDAHVDGARESALDPASAGGGGCGCN